jgi:hypothetical protein
MVEEDSYIKNKKPEHLQVAFWFKCFFSIMWACFMIGLHDMYLNNLWRLFLLTGTLAMVVYWMYHPYPFDIWTLWDDNEYKESKGEVKNEK